MLSEPLAVTLAVIQALEILEIPYLIVGSLASSLHGVARTSLDSDLLVDMRLEHAESLYRALENDFYINLESIREAIRTASSFSVIHLEMVFKVDIFISKGRPIDRQRFARRIRQVIVSDPERGVYVASAEDTILAKLAWYRLGQEVSGRQWQDVLGIIKIQGAYLDLVYLRNWASEDRINDLLEIALKEAGPAS